MANFLRRLWTRLLGCIRTRRSPDNQSPGSRTHFLHNDTNDLTTTTNANNNYKYKYNNNKYHRATNQNSSPNATTSNFNNNTPTTSTQYSQSQLSDLSDGIVGSQNAVQSQYSARASANSTTSRPFIANSYTTTSPRRSTHTDQLQSEAQSLVPLEVPRGLTNLGNTCYMNSVIQSLFAIGPFRQLIESSYTSKPLVSGLRDLFKLMKRSQAAGGSLSSASSSSRFSAALEANSASAASFKQAFGRNQSKFLGFSQQDAQEFLRYLINGCHDEMNKARGHASSRQASAGPRNPSEAWSRYREIVDDSPLVDMLVGQLCSTIRCSICEHESHCWDPFWDLSLALSSSTSGASRYSSSFYSGSSTSSLSSMSCRLSDLVAHFTAPETLDSDERPICENCRRATRSSKQISFTRLPRVLILHLKKFSNDGYKLSNPEVECEQTLELLSSNNDKNSNPNSRGLPTNYQLTACISHHGHSASSGHYTAHCKYSSRWFHFNDDR